MNDISVAVVCLSYNQEKYIIKTLEGFVSQKCNFSFEVIVHDDASTDNTAEIIREYAEKYPDIIKPVFQQENQHSKGIAITREIIAPLLKGKYIAFCEGDDYWCDPNKLQKQYDMMECNPDCSICFHKVQKIFDNGESIVGDVFPQKRFGVMGGKYTPEMLFDKLCAALPGFQTSSYFMRRDVLDLFVPNNIEFCQKSPVGDLRFVLLAMTCGNAYYIDETMSCYRTNSVGSWTRMNLNSLERVEKQTKRFIEMFESYDKYTDGKYHEYCMHARDSHEYGLAYRKGEYRTCLQKRYRYIFKRQKLRVKIQTVVCYVCPWMKNTFEFAKHLIHEKVMAMK